MEGILYQVLHEQAEETAWLEKKYPWYGILVNWAIALCTLIMIVAAVVYGIQFNTAVKVEKGKAEGYAEAKAEEQAMAETLAAEQKAKEASLDVVIDYEADVLARVFYGIRLFVEKYGYTEKDFETYARCIFNRADATGKSIAEVVSAEGQFLAYSENNPVLSEYKTLATRLLKEWHTEKAKPCDLSYQFAELLESGIWLVTSPNADGYARRWQA